MKDETPVKHGYGHDPLPLTINQVAQFLIGQLTMNPHISRDAVADAHCVSQAGMSVDTFMQTRLLDGPGEEYIEDAVGDTLWVAKQCAAALGISGNRPTFRVDLRSWDAMPLVAYVLCVLPTNRELVWLGFFFRYVLHMEPSSIRAFRERVLDELSQATLCELAEKGRRAFNAMHIDDPTPAKQYPVDAEMEKHRQDLSELLTGLDELGQPHVDDSVGAPLITPRKPH